MTMSGIGCSVFLAIAAYANQEIVGYLENWGDMTKWWDNVIPGNCNMGCEKPKEYMAAITPYTTVNYGFTFLTEDPNPDQVACTSSASSCPKWDEKGIYIAKYSQWKSKAAVVTKTNNLVIPNSGQVSIMEACRLARMGPYDSPKRCSIALGGWSDWARMASASRAVDLAKLVGRMVLSTFADGIDLDFEHLTPFSAYSDDDEFGAFAALIKEIRNQFDTVIPSQFKGLATERMNWFKEEYAKLPSWQKAQGDYFPANVQYMQDVLDNIEKIGEPKLVITWTTRFNAFLPENDVWNYLLPTSPIPSTNFATDNEGVEFWDDVKDYVDKVNIMAYDAGSDAGPLQLNFTQILLNFVAGGVPAEKINIGFEPGTQAADGHWEGLEYDVALTKFVKENNFGGSMIWAINNGANTPLDNELAEALSKIIPPVYPGSPVPSYTKVDSTTGYLPKNRIKVVE